MLVRKLFSLSELPAIPNERLQYELELIQGVQIIGSVISKRDVEIGVNISTPSQCVKVRVAF